MEEENFTDNEKSEERSKKNSPKKEKSKDEERFEKNSPEKEKSPKKIYS